MHKPEMSNRQSVNSLKNQILEEVMFVLGFTMICYFTFFLTPQQQRKSSECPGSVNRVKSSSVSLSDRRKSSLGSSGHSLRAAVSNPTGPHIVSGSSLR